MTEDTLLQAILERDDGSALEILFNETSAVAHFSAASGRELDALLQTAYREGLVAGHRAEGDGSVAYWSNLGLTVDGLRRLGEWPPAGREHHSGPWDERWFGRYARPHLVGLTDGPDAQVIFRGDPLSLDDRRSWRALELLRDSGVIAGTATAGAMQDVHLLAPVTVCRTAAGDIEHRQAPT